MNKRIMLIGVMILSVLVTATSVMAGEMPGRSLNRAGTASPAIQVSTPTATPAADPIELGVGLQGGAANPTVAGRAKYEVERSGNREFDVDVWGAEALAGQQVEVYVDGAPVGGMTINSFGRGEFDMETSDGHAVPEMTAGSTVELRVGGSTLAAGQLAAMPDDGINDGDDDDPNDTDDDDDIDDIDDDDDADDHGDDDDVNDSDDDNDADDDDDSGHNDDDDDDADDHGDDNDSDDNDDDGDDHGSDDHDDGDDD